MKPWQARIRPEALSFSSLAGRLGRFGASRPTAPRSSTALMSACASRSSSLDSRPPFATSACSRARFSAGSSAAAPGSPPAPAGPSASGRSAGAASAGSASAPMRERR